MEVKAEIILVSERLISAENGNSRVELCAGFGFKRCKVKWTEVVYCFIPASDKWL